MRKASALTLLAAVVVMTGLSIHRRFANVAIQEAAQKAVREVQINDITYEMRDVVGGELWADKTSERADIDRVIRSVARMRRLGRLRVQAFGLSDELYDEANTRILSEVEYVAPYLYSQHNRQVFLSFGDTLHYVGFSPTTAGLGVGFYEELAKAK